MKYFSMSSGREKEYAIEPYRLIYSPGGMYLLAFVPEYQELRTFSVERIRGISLHEERFTPTEIPDAAFAHSIGINEGPPEHIEIAFEPRIAPYVRERQWHRVAEERGSQGRRRRAVTGRLQRLGAAQLDPVVRPAGARPDAAATRRADQGRNRPGGREVRGRVNPSSLIANPGSLITDPESLIADPGSRIRMPD